MNLHWLYGIHLFLICIVILFQFCLAIGLPWGSASMGGKFPGVQPPIMRFVAVINAIVLGLLATVTGIRAGILFPEHYVIGEIGIWVVVVFFGLGTIMNTITPSKIERIWAPVAGILFITSLLIGLH